MVQLMKSGNRPLEPEMASFRDKIPVKLEIEDSLEEEHGPFRKRSKTATASAFPPSDGTEDFPVPPSQYNPLDEPSPLGLRLRKSPSLLDLIQMKLSQSTATSSDVAECESFNSSIIKENKGTAVSGSTDKLKASNFPATLLRIGGWEYKSRYEGDLVAKCYFAKHKLVWEILEGGLKSKIEIQWSDIMALKAHCPDNGPGTLNVVLARQPLFFRETNPQPRKHTLWQATADFTDGQATIHRQHFLQCPQGLLNKHFEKLIQCDMRLNFLSRQPEIVLDSPYFERRVSVFEDPEHQAETSKGSTVSVLTDGASPSTQQSSLKIEQQDSTCTTVEHHSQEAPSPCSAEASANFEVGSSRSPRNWEQMKVPGLHPSMSMSDLVNHIGHCITEQMTAANPSFANQGPEYQDILEDIAQYLLNDNQSTTSDEKSLMKRVNSLCCLLQKDTTNTTTQNSLFNDESRGEGPNDRKNDKVSNILRGDVKAFTDDVKDSSGTKQAVGMTRKDSFGELLLQLPRIASIPKFLFNISEEDSES
ncbi:uncharacterized protein LOC111024711 isoform X3 [Momordica charantia]|uniref:Uncharacterized protein LOC111024711 isoform X3 n=1 Tax=Momordica charantia TaxID=3673 RepID=A0A6J1DYL5_MOMCH|nr:uncharacterized protein LOC111024711 isoform X3 [Momordica charantia]